MTSFGFLEGGTVNFTGVKLNSEKGVKTSSVNCSVCTNEEYANLIVKAKSVNSGTLRKYCKTVPWGSVYKVPKEELYRIFFHHSKGLSGKGQVILMNPGGEHLSVGYTKLPSMYAYPTVAWVGAGVLYLIVVAVQKIWRTHVAVNGINVFLGVMVLMRFVYCACSILFWRHVSTFGTVPTRLFNVRIGANSIFETITLGLVMLLSRGWYTMVPPRFSLSACITLSGLLATLFFYYQNESRAMYIGVLLFYFFLMPQITGYSIQNLNLLSSFLRLGHRMNASASFAVVRAKLEMFGSIRSICLMLFLGFCLSKSIIIMSAYSNVWVVLAVLEATYFAMALSLYYVVNPFTKSLVFDTINTSDFIGPAARMAAHPYEGTDHNSEVFVRDDFEGLVAHKDVAVVKSFDGKSLLLAVRKDIQRK